MTCVISLITSGNMTQIIIMDNSKIMEILKSKKQQCNIINKTFHKNKTDSSNKLITDVITKAISLPPR